MTRVRPPLLRPAFLRIALAATAALALSGCISLLPKTKPSHLYRFGQPAGSEAMAAGPGKIGVFRTNATFQRESAGDRLLTVTDGQVQYVAETRWVAPAAILWDQAVLAAFDADPGPVRLISRGEPASAQYILRLDVRNFEARYGNGPKAPPSVLVRVRAVITRSDRAVLGEKIFETQVTAADNRVTAIVPAYDRAVAQVLKEVIAWTTEQAKPA